MNDIHKMLYDLLENRGKPTKERLVDKRIDDEAFEVTLDYTDKTIDDYVVLAQDNTIIIRYEDTDDKINQDAIQTNRALRPNTLTHKLNNNYLTISVKHTGGNHGKRTHSR
jgi:hypothetical protein